jgi:hypothetical protein
MVAFIETLRVKSAERARRVRAGILLGRGAFIATYNNLLLTGKSFAYDAFRDRYYYDGREITGGVLAELRLLAAKECAIAPDHRTVRDAVKALCQQHSSTREQPKDVWHDAIADILQEAIAVGDRERVRVITIYGVPHWCVAMYDLKQALDVRGRNGSRRIRSIMRILGWQARSVIICGHRMRGFVQRVRSGA